MEAQLDRLAEIMARMEGWTSIAALSYRAGYDAALEDARPGTPRKRAAKSHLSVVQ
jgi:hypothetical protein